MGNNRHRVRDARTCARAVEGRQSVLAGGGGSGITTGSEEVPSTTSLTEGEAVSTSSTSSSSVAGDVSLSSVSLYESEIFRISPTSSTTSSEDTLWWTSTQVMTDW